MIYYLIVIIFIAILLCYIYKMLKKTENYTNIFGNVAEGTIRCQNNNIQKYIRSNPITDIRPCNEKNLLTAENYFRYKYLNLPLNEYNNTIQPNETSTIEYSRPLSV